MIFESKSTIQTQSPLSTQSAHHPKTLDPARSQNNKKKKHNAPKFYPQFILPRYLWTLVTVPSNFTTIKGTDVNSSTFLEAQCVRECQWLERNTKWLRGKSWLGGTRHKDLIQGLLLVWQWLEWSSGSDCMWRNTPHGLPRWQSVSLSPLELSYQLYK